MKKFFTTCLAVCIMFCASASAFAMEVPISTVVQNLNGTQQYIKTFSVDPSLKPECLIEDDFDYEGYTYSYSEMVKDEHFFEDEVQHTEVITAETSKKDLVSVLEVLPVSVEYNDGKYSGTLRLDHTSICTEPAGYASRTSAVCETREIGDLADCDMSYVPATVQKDGQILSLSSCQWEVMGTTLVDDILVPSCYKAIASYTGQKKTTYATGYITTADYTGTVSCKEVDSITYTVTYIGREIDSPAAEVLDTTPAAVEDTATPSKLTGENKIFAGTAEMLLSFAVIAAVLAILIVAIVKNSRNNNLETDEKGNDKCEEKTRS